MSLLKVEVTGLDSLDKDFEKHKNAIKKQIPTALGIVGAEMVNDLQAIIEGYFYPSYIPSDYVRRNDNQEKGTAMKDDSNMHYETKENTLEFLYIPVTSHSDYTDETAWIQDRPQKGLFPISSRGVDDLIVWGQHWHFMNDSGNPKIPARPFWNYFLESQANEKIMDNFARGMLPKYEVIKEKGEVVDLSDSMLPSDAANVAPYDPNTVIDDDLPF